MQRFSYLFSKVTKNILILLLNKNKIDSTFCQKKD